MALKTKSARRLNRLILLKISKFTHERRETDEIPFAYFLVIRGFPAFCYLKCLLVYFVGISVNKHKEKIENEKVKPLPDVNMIRYWEKEIQVFMNEIVKAEKRLERGR